jgi:nucleotide-binding universal stress UspA family protein
MNKVLACIDGSPRAAAVCDYAAWAARCLEVPLELLHVLERHPERASASDLSGIIGMDAHDNLLEQLSDLDARRSKLAQEHGRDILQAAHHRALATGATVLETLQRHGPLVETLLDLQADTRLVVMGQHQSVEPASRWHWGQNAERVVRALYRPVLVVAGEYKVPTRVLIAFDGSPTGRKMIETVAGSPLLARLSCHVVMVTEETAGARDIAAWAGQTLQNAGFSVEVALRAGEAESVLRQCMDEFESDLLVMGAYGHSRIRHLIMGSTTSALLRTSPVPVFILR